MTPAEQPPRGTIPSFTDELPLNHANTDLAPQTAAGLSHGGPLPSQVDQTLAQCPRFRVLLLGKSGSGKSSLINKVFGVTSAEVANYRAGNAQISEEHTSKTNPYFVFHDSMGFESGSSKEYSTVEDFIQERGEKTEIAEQVHAIWLCTSIPINNDRVFEAGDERIFRLNLRNIPIVVVFTMYDQLIHKAEESDEELDDEDEIRAKADGYFDELGVKPLRQICAENLGREVPPFQKVSVKKGYEDTLTDLIRLTRDLLPPDARDQVPADIGYQPIPEESLEPSREATSRADHIDDQDQRVSSVVISFSVAQRAEPDVKTDAIVAIGRQKYWFALMSSLDFSGKELERYMVVIHNDIVKVWNFHDPRECLSSAGLRSMMTRVVHELFEKGNATTTAKLAANCTSAAAVTGIATLLAPLSATVVGYLTLSAVAAKWVYDVYRQGPGVLRCLMAYIVDLTIVLRRLFWRMQARGGALAVPEDLVEQSVNEYNVSPDRVQVHRTIWNFVEQLGPLQRVQKDLVVGEIEKLIRLHRFQPSRASSPIS